MSIDDWDKLEEKEMKIIRPITNTSYDWLINYIPETIRKSVGDFEYSVWEKKKTKQIKNTKTIWRKHN